MKVEDKEENASLNSEYNVTRNIAYFARFYMNPGELPQNRFNLY